MADQDKMKHNRGLVVFGAILIQIALGGIYAWPLYTCSLLKDPYNFSITQIQAIFSSCLISFTLAIIFTNTKIKKFGFKLFLILGGLALGSGYSLSSQLGTSFFIQFVCVGIISGAGFGFAYGIPVAVCVKWYPDKKALISGLTAVGFGAGTILWIQAGGSWFGLVESMGIQSIFLYYGIAFFIFIIVGSFMLSNPPEGNLHEGYKPPATFEDSANIGLLRSYTWQGMLNQLSFWVLWLIFLFSGIAGLMVIGTIQLLGADILTKNGLDARSACAVAGNAMALFALFSVPGLIIWSNIGNKLGQRSAIFLMNAIQGILMLTLFFTVKQPIMLMVYASAIGFNFGGINSLFHSTTAILFGAKNLVSNYLLVFTAFGFAGIAGPGLGGLIRENTGSFLLAFIAAGVVCIIGSLLALTIKFPVERRVGGRRMGEIQEDSTGEQLPDSEKRKILGSRKSSDRRIEKGIPWSQEGHGHIADISE